MIFYILVKPVDHIFKYNHSSIRLIFKARYSNDCLYENIKSNRLFNLNYKILIIRKIHDSSSKIKKNMSIQILKVIFILMIIMCKKFKNMNK